MSVLCPTHNTPCRRVGAGSKVFFVCKQSGCKFVQWVNSQDAPPASQSSPPQPPTSNPPTPALSPTPTVTPTRAPETTQVPTPQKPTVNTINDSTSDDSAHPLPNNTDQLHSSPQPQEPRKRIKLSQLKLARPNPPNTTTPIIQNSSNINPKPILPTRVFFQSNSTPTINNTSSHIKLKSEPSTSDTVSKPSLPPSPKPNSTSNYNAENNSSKTHTSNVYKPPTSNNVNEHTKTNIINKPTIPPPPSPPTTPTKQTISTNQSPKKTPTDEMKKNSAVLGASPMGKKAIPIDNPGDSSDDFKTPPKNIKQPKSSTSNSTSTTTASTADTTTTTTTTDTNANNSKNKGKKMLSLDILNGKTTSTTDKNNKNKNKNNNNNKPDITKPILRPPGKEQAIEKVIVDLQVSGPNHIGITKKIKNKEIEEVFLSIPGNKLDQTSFLWSFPINQNNTLMNKLRQIGANVKPVPKEVLNALQEAKERDSESDTGDITDFTNLPPNLFAGLLGFQIEGLMFAARNGGRCLIADEMGLGKTIQAIAVAACYRSEWPLLNEPQVNVINNGKDKLKGLVNIISYELAVRAEEEIKAKEFKVVICDESHYMKSMQAERTQVLVPIIQQTPRAILLTGTPALSRPSELFPQLLALGKQMFKSFKQYATRYCAAFKKGKFWDYSGNSHLQELHVILSQTVMIRRLKADVLSDLPNKHRSTITIDISEEDAEAMRGTLAEAKKLGTLAKQGKNRWAEQDKKQLITQLYTETARAKIESVCNYIIDLVSQEPDRKFLVFAHHKEMLDGIEGVLVSKRVTHMRIDGSTSPSARSANVHAFQTFKKPQVAVLSMTAAGTGLTLNAASLVIFTELYWTPGVLRQCEDRVHRIGQKDDCDIRYLVAKNTLDENIWPLICHKLEVIGEALDGQEEVLETTEMDYVQTTTGRGTELDTDPIVDDDILTAVFDDYDYIPSFSSSTSSSSSSYSSTTTTTSTTRTSSYVPSSPSSPSSPLATPFGLDLGPKTTPKDKAKEDKEKKGKGKVKPKAKGQAKGNLKREKDEEKQDKVKKAKGKEKRKRGGSDEWGFDDIPVMNDNNKKPRGNRGTQFMDTLDIIEDDTPPVSNNINNTNKNGKKTNTQSYSLHRVEDIEDSDDDRSGFKRARR